MKGSKKGRVSAKDRYVDEIGKVWVVNYGGVDFPERVEQWGPWEKKFVWWPIKAQYIETSHNIRLYNWVWLRSGYVRRRRSNESNDYPWEYEFCKDLFDLIKRESR